MSNITIVTICFTILGVCLVLSGIILIVLEILEQKKEQHKVWFHSIDVREEVEKISKKENE